MARTRTERETLHQLIETLPEEQFDAAELLLQHLHGVDVDPLLLRLYSAPWDDEPETEEERAAEVEAKEEIARGEGILWEVVRQQFLDHE